MSLERERDSDSPTAMLPQHFLWGFATASYQIEGAPDADGRGPSIWDSFSRHPGKTLDGRSGDSATDSYNLLSKDLDLLQSYGARSYRFSLSWSRIIPLGGRDDPVNEKGIQYYNRLINGCLERGIVPFVTLYHWDLPLELHKRYGGWLNKEEIIKDYTNYARVCFEAFGDRVTHWLTFNEPWCIAVLGYGRGVFAPGRSSSLARPSSTDPNDIPHAARESGQPDGPCFSPWIWEMAKKINPQTSRPYHLPYGDSRREPWIVGHNVLLAHASAVHLYRTVYKPKQLSPNGEGGIGITLNGDYALPLHSPPTKSLEEVLAEASSTFDTDTDTDTDEETKQRKLEAIRLSYETQLRRHQEDKQAAQKALDFAIGWFADPVYLDGEYPAWMREVLGDRLPVFTEEERYGEKGVKGSSDFYGMNTYTTNLCTSWRPTMQSEGLEAGGVERTVTHTNANANAASGSANSNSGSTIGGGDEEFPYLGDEYQGLVDFTFNRPITAFEPPAGSIIPVTIPPSPLDTSSNASQSQAQPLTLSYPTRGPGIPLGTQASCAWLQAYSPGFRLLLNYLWRRYKKPIYVTENGFAERGEDERYRLVGELKKEVRKLEREVKKVENAIQKKEKEEKEKEKEEEEKEEEKGDSKTSESSISDLRSHLLALRSKLETQTERYTNTLSEALHDPDRLQYFADNLQALKQAALGDGVDVRGYFAWSLMDNFEWADGYGTRFGVSWVDFGFESDEEETVDEDDERGEEKGSKVGGSKYERREKSSGKWVGEWFKKNVKPNSDLLATFPSLSWRIHHTQQQATSLDPSTISSPTRTNSSNSTSTTNASTSTSATETPAPMTPISSFDEEAMGIVHVHIQEEKKAIETSPSVATTILTSTTVYTPISKEEKGVVEGIREIGVKRKEGREEGKGVVESVQENAATYPGQARSKKEKKVKVKEGKTNKKKRLSGLFNLFTGFAGLGTTDRGSGSKNGKDVRGN